MAFFFNKTRVSIENPPSTPNHTKPKDKSLYNESSESNSTSDFHCVEATVWHGYHRVLMSPRAKSEANEHSSVNWSP